MNIQWLGRQIEYRSVYDQMKALLNERVNDNIDDQLLLVEHRPVYTIGRSRNAAANLLNPNGVQVEHIERGGDVTFHGTGQLTGYPIVKLPQLDIHAYLRFLEEFWIGELAKHTITATRDERNTGVWVEGKKMVAIGVAMRRQVCWHGFACNLTVDLSYFQNINPCGMSSDLVTRWSDHATPPNMKDYALELGARFETAWITWCNKSHTSSEKD